MSQEEIREATSPAGARVRTLGPVLVLLVGCIAMLSAMYFAASAPDAIAEGPPLCDGEVMTAEAVCEQTRREFVTRTGQINWYQDVEEILSYDEMAAIQNRDASLGEWLRGLLVGTLGVLLILGATRWLVTGRTARRATTMVSLALLPLLVATGFVGWAEMRFEPDERPGVFLWWHPGMPAAAIVMAAFVALGTVAVASGARFATPDPAAARRGPGFAGYQLARWWERVLARLLDTIVIAVGVFIVSIVVAFLTFVAGRPLLGEDTAIIVMNVLTFVLALLIAIVYDAQIGDDKGDGNTVGKRAMNLRVLSYAEPDGRPRNVPEGAAFVRALTWWAPILAVAVLSTDLGPIGPVPYAYVLLLLPVLNGLWPLWDRPARSSLNDRVAKTVVVRTGES